MTDRRKELERRERGLTAFIENVDALVRELKETKTNKRRERSQLRLALRRMKK